jgi:UDP-3-O-[3-hydroxymyristoyl] glucosamine N-acyltransferase
MVAATNVRIESGCVVEAGAIILEGTVLERNSIVRAGAVVGAEGFHPVPDGDGMSNMPHFGGVVVGRGAQVGANSVVCRSVFSNSTTIGDENILGPLVYIAHGVRTGNRCRIAASARICGSSTIGDDVFVGPNAVISNQITVGDGARISIGSVVVRDVPAGETVTGHFAVEHRHFMRTWKGLFK